MSRISEYLERWLNGDEPPKAPAQTPERILADAHRPHCHCPHSDDLDPIGFVGACWPHPFAGAIDVCEPHTHQYRRVGPDT